MSRLTLACPKCKKKELWYEAGVPDQTAGPPEAWEQGYDATCVCENCGWEPDVLDGWEPELEEK